MRYRASAVSRSQGGKSIGSRMLIEWTPTREASDEDPDGLGGSQQTRRLRPRSRI